MSGRHWNEEAQRWEEAGSGPGAVSSPPPPRPEFAPPAPWPGPEGQAWPGPEGQEPPPPPPGRARRFAVVVLGAAVLGAAVATTVVLLGRGDDPAPDPKPTGTSAAPTSSAPTPTPTPTPTASPTGELPAGYRQVTDAAGFTLVVPEGWDRSESKQGVFYTSPDESSLIQIFTITEPDTTPLESLRVASDSLSNSLSKDGYEQTSLEKTSAPEGASEEVTDDAAELVYAYDSEKLGARRKVVDFSFAAQDGTQYAVLVAGPETEWPEQRDRLATALSRFAQG